jgi:hypothetical protein
MRRSAALLDGDSDEAIKTPIGIPTRFTRDLPHSDSRGTV